MVAVSFVPHALARLAERGATREEATEAVRSGASEPAKLDRTRFTKDFPFDALWQGKRYATKRLEVVAVEERGVWLVITAVVKFF